MAELVRIDSALVPRESARISPFDRGYLFSDGVYEVVSILDGYLVDCEPHLARLDRSCREIAIALPASRPQFPAQLAELASLNAVKQGYVYIQVTRGVSRNRDFAFPSEDVQARVFMFTERKAISDSPEVRDGIAVVSVPEQRWERRDIKSISLLPQVLAKQAAGKAGATEAWMVQEGLVTEGASSTAYIVDAKGTLITRPLSTAVLAGVTRKALLEIIDTQKVTVDFRPFTLKEARLAREAFITSATTFVTPVVRIDGRNIGDGCPGPITRSFRAAYFRHARGQITGG